jgi:hypothetical protein
MVFGLVVAAVGKDERPAPARQSLDYQPPSPPVKLTLA